MLDIDKLWSDVSDKLSAQMITVSYEVWIKNLEPVCVTKDGALVLLAASQSAKKMVNKNYQTLIDTAVKESNSLLSHALIIEESEKEKYIKLQDENIADEKLYLENKLKAPAFTAKYTFDNFVVGSSNKFAFAAAQAVAENPGTKHNPLLIYGGVGLGKTHLMHAIGNYIKQHKSDLKILYTPSNNLTNELVDSMVKGNKDKDVNTNFREKYRNVDILMIDDIQFLAGRTGTQEVLFHIFNDLFQNGKQIILTSDRPPKEISPLEERLRTRFEWGLIANIVPPDLETRVAILQKKAIVDHAAQVSPEVLRFIAEKVESNIREMEGLLTKVIFYANLIGKPATSLDVAYDALKDYVDNKSNVVDANYIIDVTCSYFNILKSDLCGKKKNKEIVEPRQICMYLIYEILGLPLNTIGGYFGGKDHTTILYAKDKISNLIDTNNIVKREVSDLYKMIVKN